MFPLSNHLLPDHTLSFMPQSTFHKGIAEIYYF